MIFAFDIGLKFKVMKTTLYFLSTMTKLLHHEKYILQSKLEIHV